VSQMHGPLSAEFGNNKTVKTRLWPWLEPFVRPQSLNPFKLSPFRSAAAGKSASRRELIWSPQKEDTMRRPALDSQGLWDKPVKFGVSQPNEAELGFGGGGARAVTNNRDPE